MAETGYAFLTDRPTGGGVDGRARQEEVGQSEGGGEG